MDKNRIVFCDALRGFAAVIVMLSHFTIGFNALHGYLYNPDTTDDVFPAWFLKLLPIDRAFGVALFFLISGFIIPFSLQKRSAITFLKARFIRIYPVYIVCAFITMIIGFMLSGFNFHQLFVFIKSITLFRDWLGGPAIDGVLWTLEIECKFYLYIALMLPFLKKSPTIVILVPLIIVVFFMIFLKIPPSYPIQSSFRNYNNLLNAVLYDFGFLCYMNIGLIVYSYHVKKFNFQTTTLLILTSLAISLLFIFQRYTGNNLVVKIYFFSFLVFIVFYKYGHFIKGRFSSFFAKISYPLYAIHSSLGFTLLSIFIFKYNINPFISLLGVVGIIIVVSYIIHRVIELPSMIKSSAL